MSFRMYSKPQIMAASSRLFADLSRGVGTSHLLRPAKKACLTVFEWASRPQSVWYDVLMHTRSSAKDWETNAELSQRTGEKIS